MEDSTRTCAADWRACWHVRSVEGRPYLVRAEEPAAVARSWQEATEREAEIRGVTTAELLAPELLPGRPPPPVVGPGPYAARRELAAVCVLLLAGALCLALGFWPATLAFGAAGAVVAARWI